MQTIDGLAGDSAGVAFVVGEALVDIAVGADGVERRMPGGSPMNVAFGLARLGVSTTLLSCLGNDDDGSMLMRHLASAGVNLADGSVLCNGRTSSARAKISAEGAASYEFDLRWDLPRSYMLPVNVTAVHMGSIATVLEPGATRALELFENVPAGVLRTFDPNVRPAITPERSVVLAQVERFARKADILKLSDEDSRWLLPDADAREVERWALELGVAVFALTRGGNGCVIATPDHRIEQQGIPSRVVDTIGAGDAFMSGLIAGTMLWGLTSELKSGLLSFEATNALGFLAQRAASATVSRAGAQPPSWKGIQEVVAPDHPFLPQLKHAGEAVNLACESC